MEARHEPAEGGLGSGWERRRPPAHKIFAGVLAFVLAGWDPLEPDAAVGVSLGEGGHVHVHVALCPGEALTRLELVRTTDGVVGHGDDTILWAIDDESADTVGATGFRLEDFVVGVVPDGYEEAVELKDLVGRKEALDVRMLTTSSEQIVLFSISMLSRDRILSEGTMRSPEGSVSRAEDVCELKAKAKRRAPSRSSAGLGARKRPRAAVARGAFSCGR